MSPVVHTLSPELRRAMFPQRRRRHAGLWAGIAWALGLELAIAGLIAALVVATTAHAEGQNAPYSASDVAEAIQTASEATGVPVGVLERVVRCEDPRLDPYAVGDGGTSFGIAQLNTLPTGLYRHFLSVGYTDAFDPFQSAEYLARAISGEWANQGIGGWRWSCWWRALSVEAAG